MKSFFIVSVLAAFMMLAPARAQDPKEKKHTVVFDGHSYEFSILIKEKQSYRLTLSEANEMDTVDVYGDEDVILRQIRFLFNRFSTKLNNSEKKPGDSQLVELQKEEVYWDSIAANLRVDSFKVTKSLEYKSYDTTNLQTKINIEADSMRIMQDLSRLQKGSIARRDAIEKLKVKQQTKSYFPDSICLEVYNVTNLFISNFYNEKTAENWGMTNAQFAELETMEAGVRFQNDRIDELRIQGRTERKLYNKKMDTMEEEINKKNAIWTQKVGQLKNDTTNISKKIQAKNGELKVEQDNLTDLKKPENAALSSIAEKIQISLNAIESLKTNIQGLEILQENTIKSIRSYQDSISETKQYLAAKEMEQDSILNNYSLQEKSTKYQRNLTGAKLQKLKRRYIQPSVYLSGSAFAYLNKSINNDSMRSNILAVGLYAEKGDLSCLDMQITFGQSEDIISGNNRDVFGSSILVPGIRSLSFLSHFNQNTFLPNARNRFWRHLGGGMSFNVSQVQWRWTNSDSMNINNGNAVRVVPLAVDAYLSYNWLRTQRSRVNMEAKTNIYTDFGLASRTIMGNVSQSDELLKHFTGSDKTFYLGLLFGCKIKVDRLTIFYHGVLFPTGRYGAVPGLTGGQIVSSLGFRADIVQFK